CDVCPLLAENLELRQQAGSWKSMHQRACSRITELQAELEQVRAQLRLRERRLFGRKAEHTPAHPPDQAPATGTPPPPPPRPPRAPQPLRPAPRARGPPLFPPGPPESEFRAPPHRVPGLGHPGGPFPGPRRQQPRGDRSPRLPPPLPPAPLPAHLPLRLPAGH